jgi:hypothetical protein
MIGRSAAFENETLCDQLLEVAGQDRDHRVHRRTVQGVGPQGLFDLEGELLFAVEEERLLGREVVVDRLLRDVTGDRDVAHAHVVEPAL